MPNGPLNGAPRASDGPRSPPASKNTSHVPCKFFKQGTCQAGSACPFGHDLTSTADTVCKYFAKGNCKFGLKCANIHVMPNGLRINYTKHGPVAQPLSPMNLGGRINPEQYNQNSALTHGFMGHPAMGPAYPYSPMRNQDEAFSPQNSRPGGLDTGAVPTIDTSYASHQNSAYGSPRDELDPSIRSNLGLSPGNQGLNIQDAGLPASFDSNGVSLLYRNGPQAASVPSKFGLEFPPQSLASRDGHTSETLKDLHISVYGDDTRDRFNGVASSPTIMAAEGLFPKRSMHSQRIARPKISASVPKGAIDQDWDLTDFDDEYLPENLKELFLSPMEKARRGSRNAEEEGRPIHSGAGTPADMASKFGSPSNGSPGSRWNSTFIQKQMRERDEEEKLPRTSQFGHVGSPLRSSTLQAAVGNGTNSGPTPKSRPGSGSGDVSPYVASPPAPPGRQAQVSLIAQGLQRSLLSKNGNENGQHAVGSPGSLSRVTTNPSNSRREVAGERSASSSSIGAGRFATSPIDEEQPDCVFDMDEDEAASTKRHSGGFKYPVGGRSPYLGAMGARTASSGLATTGNTSSNANAHGSNLAKLFSNGGI